MQRLKSLLLVTLVVVSLGQVTAQELDRVEPPFWWAGMVNPELQLLIYGEDISALTPVIDHEGVELVKVSKVKNPNYLFVDLRLADDVKPGQFAIDFKTRVGVDFDKPSIEILVDHVVETKDLERKLPLLGIDNQMGGPDGICCLLLKIDNTVQPFSDRNPHKGHGQV